MSDRDDAAANSQTANEQSPKGWEAFFQLPTTFLEWFVIACILLVLAALLLMPYVDEGSSDVKRRLGTNKTERHGQPGAGKEPSHTP